MEHGFWGGGDRRGAMGWRQSQHLVGGGGREACTQGGGASRWGGRRLKKKLRRWSLGEFVTDWIREIRRRRGFLP